MALISPPPQPEAETGSVVAGAAGFTAFVHQIGRTRAVLGLATVIGVLFALSDEDGPVLCPFRRCTGGYCPGCGLTRSGGRLLRGDVAGSWQQHPYLIMAAVQVAAVAAVWQLGSAKIRTAMGSVSQKALAANLLLLTVIWVVRLFNGSIPVPFFN